MCFIRYEGPSKSSAINGSPCARRGYASIILCIRICHSIMHRHVKYQRNRANINNAMCIQNNLSHIHWPLFEDEKEESVTIRGVYFLKKSFCVETFARKGM